MTGAKKYGNVSIIFSWESSSGKPHVTDRAGPLISEAGIEPGASFNAMKCKQKNKFAESNTRLFFFFAATQTVGRGVA